MSALIWPQYTNLKENNWRRYMAEQLAREIDFDVYGILGIYLFGSTEHDNPGVGSDIDLLVHVDNNESQQKMLRVYFDAWDLALINFNRLITGYSSNYILDVHYVTDEDIKRKTSYAIKISSKHEPAAPLKVQKSIFI